jgi:hypothetical protein
MTTTGSDIGAGAGGDIGGDIVTSEDVIVLNRAVMVRAAAFARLAGTALLVVAGVAVAAWVWVTVRQQQAAEDSFVGFPGDEDLSLGQRVDLFANTLTYLIYAAVAGGVGVALRLLADYTVARTGGSLTGFESGDTLPDPEPGRDDYVPPRPSASPGAPGAAGA